MNVLHLLRRGIAVLTLVLCAAVSLPSVSADAVSAGYTTWTLRARPPSYPQTPTMVAETAGRLLAWAFCDQGCPGHVWEYNIATNSWKSRAPLPRPLRHAAGAALAGTVYSIGGIDATTGHWSRLVWAYDSSANTWHSRAPLPAAVAAGKTAVAAGAIYVAGDRPSPSPSNTLYRYDPAANTWTVEATIPQTTTDDYALAAIDGVIYVAGSGKYPTASRRVLAYTLATRMWSTIAPEPHARLDPAAIRGADNRLYVLGGQANGFCCTSIKSVDVYDPATRKWSSAPSMNVGREFPAAARGTNGAIYALGGVINGSGTARSIEELH